MKMGFVQRGARGTGLLGGERARSGGTYGGANSRLRSTAGVTAARASRS
jgi:hypothetical protein